MTVFECTQDLPEKDSGFLLLDTLMCHNVVEKLTTFGVFHGNVNKICCFNYIIDFDDMRMVKQFQEPDFSLESSDLLFTFDVGLFQKFNSDLNQKMRSKTSMIHQHFFIKSTYSFVGAQIDCQLDFTVSTLANRFFQAVIANN